MIRTIADRDQLNNGLAKPWLGFGVSNFQMPHLEALLRDRQTMPVRTRRTSLSQSGNHSHSYLHP